MSIRNLIARKERFTVFHCKGIVLLVNVRNVTTLDVNIVLWTYVHYICNSK